LRNIISGIGLILASAVLAAGQGASVPANATNELLLSLLGQMR